MFAYFDWLNHNQGVVSAVYTLATIILLGGSIAAILVALKSAKHQAASVRYQEASIKRQEDALDVARKSLEDQRDHLAIEAFVELKTLLDVMGNGKGTEGDPKKIHQLLLSVKLVAPKISTACEECYNAILRALDDPILGLDPILGPIDALGRMVKLANAGNVVCEPYEDVDSIIKRLDDLTDLAMATYGRKTP